MNIPDPADQSPRPGPANGSPAASWRCDSATFVHFEVEPSEVQAVLPPPLRADTFDGAAWAGLALLEAHRHPGGGAPRGTRWRRLARRPSGRFGVAEVRVPVVGPADERGLFVVATELGSASMAMAARLTGRLPARWSTIAVGRDVAERTVTYACRRRRGSDVSCRCTVRVGGRIDPGMTDHFLLERAVRFSVGRGGRVRRTVLGPHRWQLHDAVLDLLDDRLLAAAGLPEPQGRMVVRFSPGTELGISRRTRRLR